MIEELTVGDISNWLDKLERLNSIGAKLVHVKQLLQRSADWVIGEEYPATGDPDRDSYYSVINLLIREQRKRAGLENNE